MPKGKKGKGKGRGAKGAQKGPGSASANQGTPSSANPAAAESTTDQAVAASSSPDLESDAQKPKGPSPVGFAQGTKEELAKVVWPDRQQLISESAAVILMVSFLAIFISLIDNVFSWASRLVF